MTRIVDCREEGVVCSMPNDLSFRAELDIDKWDDAYGTGKDGSVISEMLLLEMNNALNCNIGITAIDPAKKGFRIAIAHDCAADEKTILDVMHSTVEKMEAEMEDIENYAFLFVEDGKMKLAEEHAEIADMSENCIAVVDEEFIVSPTRQCVNEIRSAFASKGIGLHTEEMWNEAKDWGESIVLQENMLGSYIYYKIPPGKPIAASICYDLFEAGVIDGHEFKGSHIPGELRTAAKGKFETFEEMTAWYLDRDGMNINRSGGVCETLTKRLKVGGIIPQHWGWFSDNEDRLIVFDPEKAKDILEDVGFRVEMIPYKIKTKVTKKIGEVLGIKCDLREHQIDPVCAWRKRMFEAKKDPNYLLTEPRETRMPVITDKYGQVRKLWKKEQEIYDTKGLAALEAFVKRDDVVKEVLASTKGPEVAGGYIKSPTGSGKTFMGMVIIGTLGEFVVKDVPKTTSTAKAKAKPKVVKATPAVRKGLPTRSEVEKQVVDMKNKGSTYAAIEKHFNDIGIDYVKRSFIYRVTKKAGGK